MKRPAHAAPRSAWTARLAAALAAASLTACGRPAPDRGAPGAAPDPAPAAPAEAPAAVPAVLGAARNAPPAARDRGVEAGPLAAARLLRLRPAGFPDAGRFDAAVSLGGAEPGRVHRAAVYLAQQADPQALRRRHAYHRLAQALGLHVVPPAAARRLALADVGALLRDAPGAPELLRRLAVTNDGTVDALVVAPAPGPAGPRWGLGRRAPSGDPEPQMSIWDAPRGRPLAFGQAADEGAAELATWARWAASPAPAPGEDAALLRDWLEALALDYLAANALRREILLDEGARALVLEDNASAFPGKLSPNALDRFLRRLAEASRFPRSLRDALQRFGPAEAAAALAPGAAPAQEGAPRDGFDGWLVPPRTLIEIDERRLALVTLIQAKVAARGDAALFDP